MSKKIYSPTEWDLDGFLPKYKSAENKQYLDHIQNKVKEFILAKNKLTQTISGEDFKQIVYLLENIQSDCAKLQVHAYLHLSKNQQDTLAKQYVDSVQEFCAKIANDIRFFHHWYIELPKSKALTLAQTLGEDTYYFTRKFETAKHTLTLPEENIISQKDITGIHAFRRLYESILSGFEFNFQGKKQSLTQMRNHLLSHNRNLRKKAHELIQKKFEEFLPILADIYLTLTKDYNIEHISLRKYENPLSVRTFDEDISEKAVHALISAARESTKTFQEFFTLKAKLLGLEKLQPYDISAPVSKRKEKDIPYEQSVQTILQTAERFSPVFEKKIIDLIERKQIDSVFHKNKRGGAFCYSLPHQTPPFVFMQYLGKESDMFTLIHELGHAIHATYAQDKSIFSYMCSIGIAETVSTLMEEVLFAELLKDANKEKKIRLLSSKITENFGSVLRAAYVSQFEITAHEMIHKGCSYQELSEYWTQLQKEQFGNSVDLQKISHSWAGIPHIFESPFYYYNYAVGNIVALLILDKYNQNPEHFFPLFEKYLSAAGTMGTVATAKIIGLDLEDPRTWKRGFAMIQQQVDELKKICE